MKIGLLVLRGDAVEESPSTIDLNHYIPQTRHQFQTLYIGKSKAEADIDDICKNGYDIVLNYMAAESADDVSTAAAITRYLEAKDISVLNRPLFTQTTEAGEETRRFRMSIKTPGMNLQHLKGYRWVILAMEMGQEEMVFSPAQCGTSMCLDGDNLHPASADFAWVREGPLQSLLKSMALDVLRVSGGGFVRVEASLHAEADSMYLEGLLCPPRAFYGEGYTTYEDVVIKEEFPGGHMAFLDMLITSKQIRSGQDHARNQHLAGVYDGFAPRYHAARANTGLSRMQENMSRDYNFSGTVLDLACGNGEFGATLHEHGVSAKVTGVDVSEGMTRSSYIQDHYEKPLLIGPMDELIMGMPEFDHVVCFAAFQFLDPLHLTACLARMFMIAQMSVTAIHEDLSEAYIENMKKRNGELCSNFNHISTLEDFGVPKGWKQVLMERFPLYDNPNLGETVYGFAVRFERT
ncbi:hypothetical protein BDV38DRAFT_257152 [Aspergillus pseudotamarii]|uniref:Methyltransferase domain-containing protein n=1 Tax=Aspergillus pseudotamarii TaxID=132259 RepID=A0A5N6SGK7_ASPPS|nr:uncharacterized protein BDV38DRAFT_257152 [Aspergillus pseudotamarii]KAE8133802.1 hypothetical protein BDV38DRAFT_257152 [Aspergillus pseudotamarii]